MYVTSHSWLLEGSEISSNATHNDEVTPSRYIAHFGDQGGFRQKLEDAIIAERGMRYNEMVWVADGARGNWNLCGDLTIKVTEVLDWVHAVENGMKCGRALLGESSAYLELWKRRIEDISHRGDVNLLISELMDGIEFASDEQLEAINEIVGYYRYNDTRMNYPEYRRRGISIGSGR